MLGIITDQSVVKSYESAEPFSMDNFGTGLIIIGAIVGVLALAYFLKNKIK